MVQLKSRRPKGMGGQLPKHVPTRWITMLCCIPNIEVMLCQKAHGQSAAVPVADHIAWQVLRQHAAVHHIWCTNVWSVGCTTFCLQHTGAGNAHIYAHVQVGLSERINAAGGQVPKKVIEAPFVQIPLGVTEDRLVGTVDIEASMKVHILFTCIQAAPQPLLVCSSACHSAISAMAVNTSR